MIYRRVLSAVSLAIIPTIWFGCGPTQVSRQNREIVESLATAVSARNAGWLAENIKLIDQRRASGQLPEGDSAAFGAIIDKANSGDWAGAEAIAFDLRDGQRASGEDYVATDNPKVREPRQYDRMPRRGVAGAAITGRSLGGQGR